MTPRIVLRPKVPDDIRSILDYFDEHSTTTGDRFAGAIEPTLNDLALMPGKGSPKQFRNRSLNGIRSWRVPGFPKYLIFYRIIEGGIEVLAITHGARRLSTLLRDRI